MTKGKCVHGVFGRCEACIKAKRLRTERKGKRSKPVTWRRKRPPWRRPEEEK